jgi:hypothetical protein
MDKNIIKKGHYSIKLRVSTWRNLKILAAHKGITLAVILEEYLNNSILNDPDAEFLLKKGSL